jgi:hypothetical protein
MLWLEQRSVPAVTIETPLAEDIGESVVRGAVAHL